MEFNSFKKKIIEYIRDERVYDITSFLSEFGYTKEFSYNDVEIKRVFDEAENGETYNVLKSGLSPSNMTFLPSGGIKPERNIFTEKDFEKKRAEIDYSKLHKVANINGQEYKFNFLQPQIINTHLTNILDFLIVWQYLKENGMVLEVDKEIVLKDISVFYTEVEKQKKIDTLQGNLLDDQKLTPVEFLSINKEMWKLLNPPTAPPKRNAMDYVNTEIEFDEERFKICESKIGLKILPTLELHFFTQRKFKTREEQFNRKSLKKSSMKLKMNYQNSEKK